MTATPNVARSVYIEKLALNVVRYAVLGGVGGALLGAGLNLLAVLNGLHYLGFVPYLLGVLGFAAGFARGRVKALSWHSNFVEGVRRVLRMSALAKPTAYEQDKRIAEADSNDEAVLNAAAVDAGFSKGIKSMRALAQDETGDLRLPSVMKDISGGTYGIQGSQKPLTSRQSAAAVAAARQAACEQVGAEAAVSLLRATALAASAAAAATALASPFDESGASLPSVNVDGTPMIEGSGIDINGNTFGSSSLMD